MYAKDLAREVGTTTDAIVERCRDLGVDLAWSGASLPDDDLDRLRASLAADPPIRVGDPTPSPPAAPVANAGAIPGYQPFRPPQPPVPAVRPLAPYPQQATPQQVGCMACGQAPAARVTFEYGIGMIVMHQTQKRTGVWCRRCGTKAFWSAQGKTLVLGWWGILSLLIYNWIHIFANLGALQRVRKLPKSP